MTLYASVFDSPVDEVFVAVDEDGAVVALLFLNGRSREETAADLATAVEWDDSRCQRVRAEVEEYFRGDRRRFEFRMAPKGTEFQHEVWGELQKIPYGKTVSYGYVAEKLGRPGAARAVGRANATNPICLAVPCHRVIGSDGSLTGYGGGLGTKDRLLAFERGESSPQGSLLGRW